MFMAVFLVWNYTPTHAFSRFSLASWLGMGHWTAEVKQRLMSNSCPVWSAVFCHTWSQEVGLVHTQCLTFLAKIAKACIPASQKGTFFSSLLENHSQMSLISFSVWRRSLGHCFETTRDYFPPRSKFRIWRYFLNK